MWFHTFSMDLSAYFVERSRLVRPIMQKQAKIRQLREEVAEEGGRDYDEVPDTVMDDIYAKVDICMNKTSTLEKHVQKRGKRETDRILKPGLKAPLDYDELARWTCSVTSGPETFNKWYYDKKTFPAESSDESDSD